MSDFADISGFEELWRPVARSRRVPDRGVLPHAVPSAAEAKARVARIVSRAPEVMVKITGRTRDPEHLQAHLKYISRHSALPLEGRDGEALASRRDIEELGADWATEDLRQRRDASLSVSIVLSMPAGTSAVRTRDAARAFAQEVFGERFDYVLALHTDAGHPHVHLAVRSLGADGKRLNPRKADLDHWRQRFAQKLRERGVAAEATLRRTRGITKKPEGIAVRKLRERYQAGRGPPPRVLESAFADASRIVAGHPVEQPWVHHILQRRRSVRAAYGAIVGALARSSDDRDRALAEDVRTFLARMPLPATRRAELVKAIRLLSRRGQARAQKMVRDFDGRGGPRRR